jgi:RHS repeat-associated protein
MTINSPSLTLQGTVTSEGQTAASTNYNYPQTPSSLSNVPVFTQRTDDWAGRTSAPLIYNFSANQAAGTSTITAPNGTITTTQSTVAQGQWNDGLITDITQQGGGLAVTTHNAWEPDSGGINPRVQQTQVTNEANQTTTTQFDYTSYNNVWIVKELGFNNEELRRTETTYETASQWTGGGGGTLGGPPPSARRLLRLPTSVKIFAGGATQPISWVGYTYDTGQVLTERDGIILYDDPATEYRGNLIGVTRYINAADPSQGSVVDGKSYDVAGNLVTQTVSCCRMKAYDYFEGYYFASVTQLTQGDTQHQENAVYDFNTGLMTQSTDQNGQVTTYEYYPDSLRLYRVTRPDGGYTITEYGDLLYADPDQTHLHSWTKTTTLIEGSNLAEEWKYIDGRGQVVRTFGSQTTQGRATTDIEYDAMGRVLRNGNPYYSQSGAASAINPAGLWVTPQYDSFSRVTQETLPDQTTAQAVYAGNVITVTDQANKSRRRVTDALGRLARMDEPDASGNLGAVSSPVQPTFYQYDALNNLVHITQGAQHRYFKYDSLSRMTYERQPEQDAPHAAADPLTGNNSWSRKIIYNEFNLVSQVTDARLVATNFAYDTLNRLIMKTYSDGSPTVEQHYDEVRFMDGGSVGYANRGRLTTVSVGAGGIYQLFNYNPMGKVSMQRQSSGGNEFEIQYFYNQGGQLIEEWVRGERQQDLTYSLDERRSYFYDVAGQLVSVNRGGHSAPQAAYASALSYNAGGALESLTYGNGATETESYNSRMQTTSQSLVMNGVVLQRYDYQYGQVNQWTGAVDALKNNGQLGGTDAFIGGTPSSPTKQWKERFSYDSLARLDVASEFRGDTGALTWQADYDFDRYGNRTSVSTIGFVAQAGSASGSPSTSAQAGSAGILPAMSAQREPAGVSFAFGGQREPFGSKITLPTAQVARSENNDSQRDSHDNHTADSDKSPARAHHARASKVTTAAASPQAPPPKIAFASNRDGSAQIYLMNTDGSGQTRLATDTNDESPRWSPDNSRILFQSDRDNPFCGVADIYVMNADGSGQTRLTTDDNDDSAAVWSPDGSKVAFQSLRNGVNYQVYVMNADGSGQVNVSNGNSNDGQPSWSPDGTKLVFTSDRDDPGRPSIYVMNANGSNQTRLTFTSAPFKDEQPAWSPDGARIAFVSTRDSVIETWTETDDEGGILTRTAVRTNKEVYVMNANGTNQVRLTNTLENDDSPGWSADGARLLFRSERERECCDPVPQVWSMNPDGTNQINLSNNEFGDYGPGWQQAGNPPPTVTNTSYDTATNRITTAGITYDAAGQTLTDAMFRGLQYQYNPEGRMIWSANLDGSNPATSVYDGLGQRVQTTQAGVTKRYFYDINGSVVAEYEAVGGTGYGALKRLNVAAAGRLLAVDEVQTDGSKLTSYLMADRQGSTRLLMNAAGAVTSRHDYFPFGEELGAGTGAPGSPTGMRTAAQGYSAADNVRQRYADTRLDDATGLDHTLWRKLETRSGRWTTPDPYGKSLRVANPQSFNRYAYVHNDPVNFKDLTGLDPDPIDIGTAGNVDIPISFDDPLETGSGSPLGNDPANGFEIVKPISDQPTAGPIEPQNPAVDVSKVETLLQNSNCEKFLNAVLAELGKIRAPYSDKFIDIFRAADQQGAFHNASIANYGDANGIVGDPSLIIHIDVGRHGGDPFGVAYTAIHETMHAAAGSGLMYTHLQMAAAAYRVGQAQSLLSRLANTNSAGTVPTDAPGQKTDNDNSLLFENIMQIACPKP